MDKKSIIYVLDQNIETSQTINDFIHFYDEIISEEVLEHYLNINKDKVIENIFKDVYECRKYYSTFMPLDEEKYVKNPYNLNVRPKEFHNSKYDLCYYSYEPFQPFLYDKVELDKNSLEHIKVGYFDHQTKYKFLSLSKNSNIWMEITPHEINTMQKSIDEAFGEVVVYGLGLGYYSYMISNKINVSKITIIENDKEIIDIFNKHILPFFENKDKISIISVDALSYEIPESTTYCFIDIYRDEVDGLPIYLKLKDKEKASVKYSYWIEESFKMMILRYLYVLYIGEEVDDDNFKHLKDKYQNKNIEKEIEKLKLSI